MELIRKDFNKRLTP